LKRFNKIKAVFSCLVLLIIMTGCNKHNMLSQHTDADSKATGNSVVKADTMNTEMRFAMEREAVLNRVKDIYRVVKADYMSHGGVYETEFYDRSYCSKSWNKLLLSVRQKEERTNTLFFEINPWSMTNDTGTMITFDEFEVSSLSFEPRPKASVSFVVCDGDIFIPACIDLVYEDGRWVIDNFYNQRYMLDVRNSMWQYISQNISYM